METFIYTFDVKGDEPLLKMNNGIYSSVFKTNFNGIDFHWKLKFSSKFENNGDGPYLYLYVGNILAECGFRYPTEAKFQFIIIPNVVSNFSVITTELCINTCFSLHDVELSMVFCKQMIPTETIMDSDKCVKILCKLYIAHKEFNYYRRDEPYAKHRLELPKVLSDKFTDQALGIEPPDGLCDVVLQSSDCTRFYCHKMILACSSEVFNAMFSRFDIKENPKNVKQSLVEIDEIDSQTLMEVLRFIYKNECSANVDNLLDNCLYAADKYDLRDLKSKCVASLKFNLMPDNVLYCLELAEKFSSHSLKMGCFEVVRLFKDVMDQRKLQQFASDHCSLYDEVVCFLYKPFDVNLVL